MVSAALLTEKKSSRTLCLSNSSTDLYRLSAVVSRPLILESRPEIRELLELMSVVMVPIWPSRVPTLDSRSVKSEVT